MASSKFSRSRRANAARRAASLSAAQPNKPYVGTRACVEVALNRAAQREKAEVVPSVRRFGLAYGRAEKEAARLDAAKQDLSAAQKRVVERECGLTAALSAVEKAARELEFAQANAAEAKLDLETAPEGTDQVDALWRVQTSERKLSAAKAALDQARRDLGEARVSLESARRTEERVSGEAKRQEAAVKAAQAAADRETAKRAMPLTVSLAAALLAARQEKAARQAAN